VGLREEGKNGKKKERGDKKKNGQSFVTRFLRTHPWLLIRLERKKKERSGKGGE